MSTYDEDNDATGGYVFGSAPPMPRQPAWDAPQAHQSSTPHPARADGTPWTFRTAELRARVTPEPRQLRDMRRATAKRYRAVVWDPVRLASVHLGFYSSEAERDAAVTAAKARRALGLPLREGDARDSQ